jgi:hypothetical protein
VNKAFGPAAVGWGGVGGVGGEIEREGERAVRGER